MSEYVANGNMYGRGYTFSSPYSNMLTEPFKASVDELYSFMLKRCLDKTHDYGVSLEFAMLEHMAKEIHEDNPLSVVLDNDTYYFNDSGVIRSIGKYESN